MSSAVQQKLQDVLFIDDNLNVLSRIPDRSVDLIATDPPFNTARFQATKTNSYPDVWRNGQVFSDVLESRLQQALIPNKQREQLDLLLDLAQGARVNGQPITPTAERTFLAFMALRALEMKRVLKETGSIYWHCDPTMSHYIKALLDIVFGKNNFRNEIVWCYTGPSNTKRYFPRKHDCLLYYAKNKDQATFNPEAARIPYKKLDTGKTSGIFKEAAKLSQSGKIPEDYWLEDRDGMTPVGRIEAERIGYPTQKPLSLYERIIKTSSNEGDIVLDPFCGCATTPIAALRTGRHFIGIDVNGVAMRLIHRRIDRQVSQGNLLEGHRHIGVVVNQQLIQDSIDDLNSLIGKAQTSKEPDQDILDKYLADRKYLQQVFDEQTEYPQPEEYLPQVDRPTLTPEKPLSASEKKAWKEKAIEEGVNQLTGYFDCPGFWAKGKHRACQNNGGVIVPNSTNLEVDRIIPASFGGDYTLSNIRLLCNQCNRRRGDLM